MLVRMSAWGEWWGWRLWFAVLARPPTLPATAPYCHSGAMVLTCGKDNLLRCVDMRRFEVAGVGSLALAGQGAGPWCGQRLLAAACVPVAAEPASPPPPPPAALQVRHTLSAPSFSVGGAWTTACLRCAGLWPLRNCPCPNRVPTCPAVRVLLSTLLVLLLLLLLLQPQ